MSGLRTHRLVTLWLLIVTFAMVASHPLELWGKLRLDGPTWLAVQQNLYVAFAPVAALAEPGAALAAGSLALREWRRGWAWQTSATAAALVVAGLVLWALFTAPVNAALNGWTAATLPPDWTAWRSQWEASHAGHALLIGAALAILLLSLVRDGDRPRKDTT
ncbi:hypothetical protein [Elioraea rosea]|uniref:hypothetical protein n=1 Tax=Elioraea rosea TaxID=2492390 RepID=UPI001182D33E|nr:hypothetical protein [Elioraea rosea]